MMLQRTGGYSFWRGNRRYLLVHAREVDAWGRLWPRGDGIQYEAVAPEEAAFVVSRFIREPPHVLQKVANLLELGCIMPAAPVRDPQALVGKVRFAILEPAPKLALFVVPVERLSPPESNQRSMPLADLVPWEPQGEEPRTNGKISVLIKRRDTLKGVQEVLTRLLPVQGTLLSEKSSKGPMGLVDFGAWPPGAYAVDVVLREEQETTFLPPGRIEVNLGKGEHKRVEVVLELDTTFEVILHDLDRRAVPDAAFRVYTGGSELCSGESDGGGVARFNLPSPQTATLTIEWSAGEAVFVQEIFTDTASSREELDEARLKNLGYSSDEDSDIAVQAFCGYYGIEDDAVVSKLDDVFRTKVLNS